MGAPDFSRSSLTSFASIFTGSVDMILPFLSCEAWLQWDRYSKSVVRLKAGATLSIRVPRCLGSGGQRVGFGVVGFGYVRVGLVRGDNGLLDAAAKRGFEVDVVGVRVGGVSGCFRGGLG